MKYVEVFVSSFNGYVNYVVNSVLYPSWNNYFYYLIAISFIVWCAEMLFPWRKNQPFIRKDFWLDNFYMFFNFFIFNLLGYSAISSVTSELYTDFWGLFGLESNVLVDLTQLPKVVSVIIFFVLADFIQWSVHVALHRYEWLWRFHKVHHSVKQMGFSAHLRYHWMENVFYKTAQFVVLSFFGFSLPDLFLLHAFTIAIGHLNHANIVLDYGPFKYVLNNPKMHIWHHAKELPKHRNYGMNFGISLSLWDYLFKTADIPHDGRDIELGFDHDENYPKGFVEQSVQGFKG